MSRSLNIDQLRDRGLVYVWNVAFFGVWSKKEKFQIKEAAKKYKHLAFSFLIDLHTNKWTNKQIPSRSAFKYP